MDKRSWFIKTECDLRFFCENKEEEKLMWAAAEAIADYVDKEGLWDKKMFEGLEYFADMLHTVYGYAMKRYLCNRGKNIPPIKDCKAYVEFVETTVMKKYNFFRHKKDNLENWLCADLAVDETSNMLVNILSKES